MKNFKDAKNIYDHIVVPEELNQRLSGILEENTKTAKKKVSRKRRLIFEMGAMAAGFVFLFGIGLNANSSFAQSMQEIPVIGSIARVLTIRSYHSTYDTTTTDLEIPEIQISDQDNPEVTKAITDINSQIDHIVAEYTNTQKQNIAEYKEAFLATGGTEEEWEQRPIEVSVSYNIKCQNDDYLSLELLAETFYVHANQERYFYNLDLNTGKELTLADFLGENAYEYASDYVYQEIKKQVEADTEDELCYWGFEHGSDIEYPGVTEKTPFYLNQNGNLVISFPKYEVAPGYMGTPEFEIPL